MLIRVADEVTRQPFVGRRALVSQAGCKPVVCGLWRFESVPAHSREVVELVDTRRSERRAVEA